VIQASEALARLQEGNRRFVAGAAFHVAKADPVRREELIEAQAPIAVVLGCSDSRVPVEIIFDQALGELFVIRVAGNIVAPSQVGSVEFAAAFGTRLVVVLGHSNCGAVIATLKELRRPTSSQSPNLRSIVERIRPSVEELLVAGPALEPAELLRHAVRANLRASVNHLRHGSAILEGLVREQGLRIVGAEYSLESGRVEFFEEM
jgi:carbonic anhydrase